jgi:hypothetical protein
MLSVLTSSNIGLFQATMMTMATFELIDGDWIKEEVWKYLKEEKVSFEMEACGIDSNHF